MYKNLDEMHTLGKASMDATTASLGAYSKGFQELTTELVDYSRKVFEDGTSAAEQLLTARTPEKALEIQGAYMKSTYEDFVARSTKLGDLYASVTRDALKTFEPRQTEPRQTEARPGKTSK